MLQFKRPAKPAGFDESSKKALQKVETKVSAGTAKPSFQSSFWGKYKNYFIKAQHHKCGYCDMVVTGYGDMEHYKPKSVVEEIKTEGEERSNTHTTKDRTFKKACELGYWWLAYDWDNYLLSCQLCNQPWKRALFPIKGKRPSNIEPDNPYPYKTPEPKDKEKPLLLNPFGKTKPQTHLQFDKIGGVRARRNSSIGKATIKTVGLDRTSLIEIRQPHAARAYKYIKKWAASTPGSTDEEFVLDFLTDIGQEKVAFSGVVRVIFEQTTGKKWAELEKYYKDHFG